MSLTETDITLNAALAAMADLESRVTKLELLLTCMCGAYIYRPHEAFCPCEPKVTHESTSVEFSGGIPF